MIKLSAIQLCSVPNVEQNLASIERELQLLTENVSSTIAEHIVVLPECCLYFGGKEKDQLTLANRADAQQIMADPLAELARRFGVTLVAGSMPTSCEQPDKFYNTSIVFSAKGEELSRYHKIHLFDVDVNDSEKQYRESDSTAAGKCTSVVKSEQTHIGQTICYDLRFPELFRHLTNSGAQIITVPAAFTRVTGQAHWQALLQARAIENQVFIVAAGQEGIHQNKRETWGHSMIISPWGEILAIKEKGVGSISSVVDIKQVGQVRANIPVQQHNRFTIEFTEYE